MFVNLSQSAVIAPETSQPHKRAVHRGSSSSLAQFDAQKFQSLAKQTSFENVFSNKQVLVERKLDLHIMNIDFCQWLLQRGWNSLYEFECPAYGSLVREFYNNIHAIGQESFKTFVQGTTIEISPDYLSNFLNIDRDLDAIYHVPEADPDDMNDEDNWDWTEIASTLTSGRRQEW